MYKIYIRLFGDTDWTLIHSPALANNNIIVFSPRITQELNKAGSLTFTVPDTHPQYSNIKPLATEIKVYDGDERIFWGRVLDTKRDFYRRKEVHCESELAFLNDVIMRPYSFQSTVRAFFERLLLQYNIVASESRRLRVGNCTVTDSNDNIVRASQVYPSVWGEMEEKLIKNLGGYLIPRVVISSGKELTYLDYLASPGTDSGQEIRFGQNLIDIEDFLDGSSAYSRIVPIGYVVDNETAERLTIKSVNDDLDYLRDTTTEQEYGVVEQMVQWDDVTIASNLKAKGQAELIRNVLYIRTITISAVDLHLLNVNTGALRIGNRYMVVSPPHGFSSYFLLSKCTLNLDDPSKSVYTFGRTRKTLTGG